MNKRTNRFTICAMIAAQITILSIFLTHEQTGALLIAVFLILCFWVAYFNFEPYKDPEKARDKM